MTETKSTDRTARRQTMADVDHVHPYDPGASTGFYSRRPAAMTDGGEREHDADEQEDEEYEHGGDERRRRTMKDVSHTPPGGDREVNRVFERGEEGHDDGR